jgi:sugar fermentation stimulation protein A
MNGGVYIAVFRLAQARRIRVGRLGTFGFAAGAYLYVGSASRNLSARLARHARRRKPLHWHVDYLSGKAPMLGAVLIPPDWRGPRTACPVGSAECRIAADLAAAHGRPVRGFGASDCRCGGHLVGPVSL